MDRAEELALEYLEKLFPGEDRIVHEPGGNVPPDFLIDGRIAVEVRRLNEHDFESNPRPLIETGVPFSNNLRTFAATLAPHPSRTLFVYVEFGRPLPTKNEVRSGAKTFLESLLATENPEDRAQTIAPNVTLKCLGELPLHRRSFIFAWFDVNSRGTPLPTLRRNLRLCVEEKSIKVQAYRIDYPEWWLILLDYVSFGRTDYEREGLREYLTMDHDWDRVVLIDPLDRSCSFEL